MLGINKHKNKIKTYGEVYADSAYANKKNDEKLDKQNNKVLHSRPLKTHSKQTKTPPIFPTIQINKTAFYPAPQKTLGILQKISPVFAKTKK